MLLQHELSFSVTFSDVLNPIPFQLFRAINIRIALTMVEIWSQRDLIHVVDDSDACLDNFIDYRNKYLYEKHKHDNAMLLT